MLNINDASKQIYCNGSIPKAVTISFPNVNITLTNSDIINESLELTEAIENGNQLSFQGCIANKLKFRCAGIVRDLRGEYVTATLSATGAQDVPLFKGYVDEQNNQNHEDVVTEFICYDVLYQKGDIECNDWYNSLRFPMTVKAFRDSFFNHIGITQDNDALINDGLTMNKTISGGTSLKARYIMQSICQANARYGKIGRDGKFHYIRLPDIATTRGTYPSEETYPSQNTFPSRPISTEVITSSMYKKVDYDPYLVEKITKVVIWDQANLTKGEYGSGTNVFKIAGNLVAFSVNLNVCARNIYGEIDDLACTSTRIELIGLPYVECGDVYKYNTRLNMMNSYVFSRVLSGIQDLKDNYKSQLDQYQSDMDTLTNQVIRLDSKTNEISRTVDETVSELSSFEEDVNGEIDDLNSSISQTAEQIRLEVTRASQAEGNLQASITVNANAIESEVQRAGTAEGNLSSRITQTAEAITSEVQRAGTAEGNLSSRITQTANSIESEVTRASNAEGDLSSRITQTAEAITSEVERASSAEGNLSSRITQTAEAITTKVSKGNVSSEISQEAGQITITSDRISITSTNFTLNANGTIKATNGEFSGKITANTGTIGGFNITNSAIYKNKTSLSSTTQGVYMGSDGICVGSSSSYFKVTSDGKVYIQPSNGTGVFNIGSAVTFDTNGNFKIGTSGNTFEVNGTNSSLTIKTSTTNNLFNVDTNNREVSIGNSPKTRFYFSGTQNIMDVGTNWYLKSGSTTFLQTTSNGVILGNSNGKVGFFGNDGYAKQTVTKLTSSATLANVITKINDLLDKLKNYNLIGV